MNDNSRARLAASAADLAGAADSLQRLLADWRALQGAPSPQALREASRAPLVLALRNLARRAAEVPTRD